MSPGEVIVISEATADTEVENLPGAIDLDAGRPRLVGCGPGRLSLVRYDGKWQLRSDRSSVVAGPQTSASFYGGALFLVFMAILILIGAEYAVWRFMAPGDDRLLWTIGVSLSGVPLFIAAAFVLWLGRTEAAKGPFFRYSRDDAQLHLPRINRVIPRGQIVRLDLISGAWVRDMYSNAYPGEMHTEPTTELHLVVRLKSGKLVSLPLLGTRGPVFPRRRGLGHAAEVLSELSGVPLEHVQESANFLDPYPKIRQRIERGLWPECGFDLRGNTSGVCPECGAAIEYNARPK